MCGRYGITDVQFIGERFQLPLDLPGLTPRYNAAPSQALPVITHEDGGRRLAPMPWGLVPGWARDRGRPLINARSEGVAEKPAFRSAFRSRRCLVPASHFFEWAPTGEGKVPHLIRRRDGGLFAFAGVYDRCRDARGEVRPGFAILTTAPNELMAGIHDRMPVILRPEDEAAWLDPDLTDPVALTVLCRPYPAGELEAYPVQRVVNDSRHDGPDVLLPLAR